MKRLLLAACALAFGAAPAFATWSIVIANTKTGEVGVFVASCTPGSDLHVSVPVVVVGRGTAVWQANGDAIFIGRPTAWSVLMDGGTPQDVLDAWLAADMFPLGKQVGVAALTGPAVSYTGTATFDYKGGVTGSFGDYTYAIQGNVLTGQPVIDATEAALIATQGDMGQKLLAAMEAGTAFGGDGRCSCSNSAPTSCGSPPPSFNFASKSGFLVVARMGDVDGVCDQGNGCGNGSYWLDLNSVGTQQGPDAVLQLRLDYDAWRLGMAGRVDGLQTQFTPSAQSITTHGAMRFDVVFRDLDGNPAVVSADQLSVAVAAGSTGDVTVVPSGSGDTWTLDVSGVGAGDVELDVRVDDGVTRALLYPRPALRVDPPAPLHCGFDTLRADLAQSVPFTIDEPSLAGAGYVLLASLSGTDPGTPFGNAVLPLNRDEVLVRTWRNANNAGPNGGGRLRNTKGFLPAGGLAAAEFLNAPGLLTPLVGERVDWAVLFWDGSEFAASNPSGFQIVAGDAR